MSDQERFSLLAATRRIGWGGVGKLRLILDQLPCADVVLYGDEQFTAPINEFLGCHHNFIDHPTRRFDAALVINDPGKANTIADLKVPVVYVDSLPYIHRSERHLPSLNKLAYYCAQKHPVELFPLTSPLLQNWPQIKWIDPIVPPMPKLRGGRGIVVNVGGLYVYDVAGIESDLADQAVESYLSLVLFPLVKFLHASGRKISAVCGNLSAENCKRIRAILPDCQTIGPQSPQAFERILTEADLLITSPGSTTILQAMTIKLPTLLLPPLNNSQFYNAPIFSRPGADLMQWPANVIDGAKIETAQVRGITAVFRYMFLSIVEAARSPAIVENVAAMIRNSVQNAPADGVLMNCIEALGDAGANQVADLVKRVAQARLESLREAPPVSPWGAQAISRRSY
jgi:hydroxymethylcytosylglucuronate/cytosylglucuronate synthase